jgi:hypothetical protein
MDKKVKELAEIMRKLLSDVQGAPYPGEGFEPELYTIWYEHVQRNAQNCFEFLDENYPNDTSEFQETINKLFN